ncbi:hypothetical protein SLEP1_g59829 [Rubroshorea leprosula]|uniref:Uncharacterized protein n=1 Tax=Rubroshorea leprosula TaxID=152421 RepID=A0AAV5MY29_9ROSI|nr:hypothetical protein SLEP1_g59829 [Rubroshorea leprosula]
MNCNPRFKFCKAQARKQASSISYSNKSSLCFASLENPIVSVEVDEEKDGLRDDDEEDDREFNMILKSDQ